MQCVTATNNEQPKSASVEDTVTVNVPEKPPRRINCDTTYQNVPKKIQTISEQVSKCEITVANVDERETTNNVIFASTSSTIQTTPTVANQTPNASTEPDKIIQNNTATNELKRYSE